MNKYYELNIYEQDDTGHYTLRCRWGRIEHFKDGNPQSQVKVKDTTWVNAKGNAWRDYVFQAKKRI